MKTFKDIKVLGLFESTKAKVFLKYLGFYFIPKLIFVVKNDPK
jgi:hypothetical protein